MVVNDNIVLEKIITGGQTGADRAALDWAIKNAIPHGGWCLKGCKADFSVSLPAVRRSVDSVIDLYYQLQETPSENYSQRTAWNVRDSDGTVIFSINKNLLGGSLLTENFARYYKKPCLHIFKQNRENNQALMLCNFLKEKSIKVLNVADSRASKEPEIYQFVERDFFSMLE